jgi:hypothetical protein
MIEGVCANQYEFLHSLNGEDRVTSGAEVAMYRAMLVYGNKFPHTP